MSDLGSRLSHEVLTGPLLVGLPIAALAGLVSFASPCVLPLVPGYLGYVTGLTGESLQERRRSRLVTGALLFVLGFSLVYVLIGAAAGGLGAALFQHRKVVSQVLGIVVVAMGLMFLGVLPGKDLDLRTRWRPVAGLAGAPLLGAVFGLGWVPCISPVLSAVTALSLQQGGAARGAVLSGAYCLGLGVPFVVLAAGLSAGTRMVEFMRRHRVGISRFGGLMLVVIGLLLATGVWNHWIDAARVPLSGVESWL